MSLKKIDHLGIAVPSLAEAIPFYRDVLGLKYHGQEEVADQKVRTAFFEIGEVHLELLEPTSPESPIAKFIEKNGGRGGIHHIAYDVDSVPEKLAELTAKGVAVIDKVPRPGANKKLIAFLHPKSTGSVLTELCQPA
ncbi:MAG: methylmalonyl-CoA epimerase [Puniceicoccales bacterium]|jgi:methylmalonyl-CoA/ethylmalonyl-CoA epimerase|nr:methylmalonyl-CoA epimerase [Puniceicoccales bacterium]